MQSVFGSMSREISYVQEVDVLLRMTFSGDIFNKEQTDKEMSGIGLAGKRLKILLLLLLFLPTCSYQ